ncbi:MAG: CPBP family intramembrane metalloprotease, partial [Oscillospiraceae bacterium]|nr:CPBP family intramembrane metalloprotease [Oscillospiraceae bacterium]
LTGIAWALWHIPMWAVRNSLGPAEIAPLLLWAVLISGALGSFYCAYENLLSVSLLHMAVNICFLAPAAWNSALLLGGILICCAFKKYRRG